MTPDRGFPGAREPAGKLIMRSTLHGVLWFADARMPLLAAMLAAASFSAAAVTPVTPHLAPESQRALAAKLDAIAYPPTARNSVFIALGRGLGMKPAKTLYRYEEPYSHLPIVDVEATPVTETCVNVALSARFRSAVGYGPIRLRARYCLTGVGEWTASEQELTRERA